ncbi:ubiquinol-cytochrome c reductase iron-sulfur subunit [Thermoleptolyngbya sichuanensis A183]|uniref:Ubiquinol-cytochrome c reductase iron-sulfur subunit n=1 Tax=Thermoleptolyngbya sichuanensis A183 TaxID=2737172 RepID=A0A6M8BCM5_9CYAN|nr:ubiquinol-cytochrome c reductase iron-sulfur subunit [Thermoleptolyngbya sichuanensis]QKD81876.1 ubiquinol-cytochrome c reductase iron-sulfur subunit [Thermoleptolyngbya sichuanensis A183]
MERRTFLGLTAASAASAALPACRSAEPPGPPAAGGTFQQVGTLSQLAQSGDRLNTQVGTAPITLLKNPDSGDLMAVSRICPHAGCTVEWREQTVLFACPCHNSLFSPTGGVVQGPANRALATYPVKVEGETILVQG